MLFNEADKLTYKDIKEQSGIDNDTELQRTLQSLALGKSRVLTKDPKVKSLENWKLASYLKHVFPLDEHIVVFGVNRV